MTVDAYMVEDAEGETHIASASDIQIDHEDEDWSNGAERFALMVERYGDRDYVEPCTVLAALELHRSIDMGLRTADGTALEVISEVCAAIVTPLLAWMSDNGFGVRNYARYGEVWGLKNRYIRPEIDWLAALCAERGIEWDGSGWMPLPDNPDDWPEPIYGQGCEQDMCEDAWSACGGVVDVSSDAGMTWLYRVVEDHTR